MGIRTAEQFIESLRDGRCVYYDGQKVDDVTTHHALRVCAELCAMDYVVADHPNFRKDFVTKIDGEEVHFLFAPVKSSEDLLRRRRITLAVSRTCFGMPGGSQFTGTDILNSLTVVSHRMDNQLGTGYSKRVEAYRKYLMRTDLAVCAGMTDVKGDRSLRPSKQKQHKDFYVRIVDEKKDGIIVRGGMYHISLSPCVNEVFVCPCRAMLEDDKDYAVSFSIPVNTPGVKMIVAPRESAEAEDNWDDYPISAGHFTAEPLMVFDDVFVPMERVFLKGEWQFAGQVAYMFANFHRLFADAYKYAELEIMVGAALLMAEYNGLTKVEHIRDKLSWLIMYAEGVDALGLAACHYPVVDPDIGYIYPSPIYSNTSKFFFADNYHQAVKYLQDITGGIVADPPSMSDFFNSELHADMEKYFAGKYGVPTEHRLRAIRLAKDCCSPFWQGATIHGEGSLAAQMLSVFQSADRELYKTAAKRVAGISDGSEHPRFKGLPSFPLGRKLRPNR